MKHKQRAEQMRSPRWQPKLRSHSLYIHLSTIYDTILHMKRTPSDAHQYYFHANLVNLSQQCICYSDNVINPNPHELLWFNVSGMKVFNLMNNINRTLLMSNVCIARSNSDKYPKVFNPKRNPPWALNIQTRHATHQMLYLNTYLYFNIYIVIYTMSKISDYAL